MDISWHFQWCALTERCYFYTRYLDGYHQLNANGARRHFHGTSLVQHKRMYYHIQLHTILNMSLCTYLLNEQTAIISYWLTFPISVKAELLLLCKNVLMVAPQML